MEGSPVSKGGASPVPLAFRHHYRVVTWQETHCHSHRLGLGQLEAICYPAEA